MMPGIGFAEMVILVLVAVVVIGPKDLPLMMRKFGRFTGKMRALAFEFKQGFDELGRQAELEELRKEVAELKKHTGMEDIQREFEQDRVNLQKDIDSALAPVALPATTAAAAAATNGAAPAEMPRHAGLSADHPGYDTGDDFKIEGHGPLPAPEATPAEEPRPAAPKAEPQPVKQDTPA